ncbi:conserved membrane hypothetical protein [Microbacterium sp. 8M]|uniref:hypothetical protein n=1 Tax=Microbacterium sp. 8M TaxID=2653153 RepID=UPI0012F21BFD|nr:hypothetical protein [Microbacterium sp. 8M]VXB40364.1 conserved membrane hypothetical protein [Microbacterium sp. 8M]
MPEALHLCALAFSAAGTCCLVVDRRRARVPEVVASLLMLLAMLDLARATPLLVPVAWAAVLIATAMILAAIRSTQVRAATRGSTGTGRSAARPAALSPTGMASHTALGMVVMSVLVLAMSAHGGSSRAMAAAGMSGMHGSSGAGVLLILFVVGYALASVVAAIRGHTRRDRIQYAAMGCSTAVMALGVLLQRM